MTPGARDFARFAALRETVARVARLLAAEGIEVAPLKGALLTVTYPGGAARRPVGDVDLLVPRERFADAVRRMLAAGARIPVPDPDERTATLVWPAVPFPIDLHHRLFRDGLYRFDEAAVLERARSDMDAFGERVLLLQPEDALAHVLAHHVGRRPMGDPARLVDDVAALAPLVSPRRAAERLVEHGLSRALYFVADDLRRQGAQAPLVDDLLARLPPTTVDRLVGTASYAGARLPYGAASSLARHLTNATLPAATRSFARHVVGSLRHRFRRA